MKNETLKNIEIMAAEQARLSGAFVVFTWHFEEYEISFGFDHDRCSSSWIRTDKTSKAWRQMYEDEVIESLALDHVEHGISDNVEEEAELKKNVEVFLGSVEQKLEDAPEYDLDDEYYDGQVDGFVALFEVRKRLKDILALETNK